MSIGVQAYLQGYLHEKTALSPLSLGPMAAQGAKRITDEALVTQPIKAVRDAFDYENNPAFDGTGGLSRVAKNLVKKHYKTPQVPDPDNPGQFIMEPAPADRVSWLRANPYMGEELMGDVAHNPFDPALPVRPTADQVTAANRAATTGRLQASGRNKGRLGIGGVLRSGAEEAHHLAAAASRPARYAAGKLAPLLKRFSSFGQEISNGRFIPGTSGPEPSGPISYEAEKERRRNVQK